MGWRSQAYNGFCSEWSIGGELKFRSFFFHAVVLADRIYLLPSHFDGAAARLDILVH